MTTARPSGGPCRAAGRAPTADRARRRGARRHRHRPGLPAVRRCRRGRRRRSPTSATGWSTRSRCSPTSLGDTERLVERRPPASGRDRPDGDREARPSGAVTDEATGPHRSRSSAATPPPARPSAVLCDGRRRPCASGVRRCGTAQPACTAGPATWPTASPSGCAPSWPRSTTWSSGSTRSARPCRSTPPTSRTRAPEATTRSGVRREQRPVHRRRTARCGRAAGRSPSRSRCDAARPCPGPSTRSR